MNSLPTIHASIDKLWVWAATNLPPLNPGPALRAAWFRLQVSYYTLPPQEQLRRGIFGGATLIVSLVLIFTSYHVQTIPTQLRADIRAALAKRPWVNELVVVDGRHVLISGEIDAGLGLDTEIALLKNMDGIATVTNTVTEIAKPAPHLRLEKTASAITLSGQLSGTIHEWLIDLLQTRFPAFGVVDYIVIDDRLGRPLWVDGFEAGLNRMLQVDTLVLDGWRELLIFSGKVAGHDAGQRIESAVAEALVPQVRIANRLTRPVPPKQARLTLLANWNGASLSATVPTEQTRDALLQAVRAGFGDPIDQPYLHIDPGLTGSGQLDRLLPFIAALDQVRELWLASSGQGFVLWGRVDEPTELERVRAIQADLGLDELVTNRIEISPPGTTPWLALFSDRQRTIINGKLPSNKARAHILRETERVLGAEQLVDLVSVEPDVAHTPWIRHWAELLALLPQPVIGLSIDADSVLVSGHMASATQRDRMERQLATLVVDAKLHNWTTVAD